MRFKDRVLGILGASAFLLSGSGAYSAHAAVVELRDAVRVELGTGFFGALSNEVLNKSLQESGRNSIDDFSGNEEGVYIEASGISYEIHVRDFQMLPDEGKLVARIAVGDVNLRVDRIYLKKGILRSSCYNTNVNIAPGSAIQGAITLGVGLTDTGIRVDTQSVDFSIPENEFRSQGPERCTGLIGGIVDRVLTKQLPKLRPKLEEKVRAQLANLSPKLQEKLNEKLARQKDSANVGKLLSGKDVFPTKLTLTKEGLDLEAGVRMDLPETPYLAQLASHLSSPRPASGHAYFAWVGVNHQLFNLMLASRFPQQVNYSEIKTENKPDLAGIFSQETLSEYIPDLRTRRLESTQLRAFVKTDTSPSLDLTEQGLFVRIPRINLKLQVLEGNEWRDYYTLLLEVAPRVDISQTENKLNLKIVDLRNVTVSGTWAPGYPSDPTPVDHTTIALTIGELLNMLAGEKASFSYDVPNLNFENMALNGTILFKVPFIGVQLAPAR